MLRKQIFAAEFVIRISVRAPANRPILPVVTGAINFMRSGVKFPIAEVYLLAYSLDVRGVIATASIRLPVVMIRHALMNLDVETWHLRVHHIRDLVYQSNLAL
jgi:hypothetical protein